MTTTKDEQQRLDAVAPADDWDAHASKRLLDELFCFARQYRTSKSYDGLLKFIARFRLYSPYNAMLVRAQMPGAVFVAPAHRWSKQYGRTIKVDAVQEPHGDAVGAENEKQLLAERRMPVGKQPGEINAVRFPIGDH